MTTSCKPALSAGNTIRGKWRKRTYRIVRPLGEGSNGKVYLVRSGARTAALKLGDDIIDLQTEVNALRTLAKQSNGNALELIDADDVEIDGKDYPFYVMNYVHGTAPHLFLRKNGMRWFPFIGYRLLGRLVHFHRHGLIFGDLKTDNVIVAANGEVELVDYGGVTKKGCSVRQFTEMYDRAYWNAGSRTADEGYDLFAFAVLCLYMAGSGRKIARAQNALPQTRSVDDLLRIVNECHVCRRMAPFFRKALLGQFTGSEEAVAEWKRLMRQSGWPDQRRLDMGIRAAFFGSVGLFATALYFLLQTP